MPRRNARPAAKKKAARIKAVMEGKAKPTHRRYMASGLAPKQDAGSVDLIGAIMSLGIARMFRQ